MEDRKEMNGVLPYQLNSESSLLERKTAISNQKASLCAFHSPARPQQGQAQPVSTFPKPCSTEPGLEQRSHMFRLPTPTPV